MEEDQEKDLETMEKARKRSLQSRKWVKSLGQILDSSLLMDLRQFILNIGEVKSTLIIGILSSSHCPHQTSSPGGLIFQPGAPLSFSQRNTRTRTTVTESRRLNLPQCSKELDKLKGTTPPKTNNGGRKFNESNKSNINGSLINSKNISINLSRKKERHFTIRTMEWNVQSLCSQEN